MGDGPDISRYKEQAKAIELFGQTGTRTLDIADVCVLPSRYEP